MSHYHIGTQHIPIEFDIMKQNERDKEMSTELKVVKFIRSWNGYGAAEIAGFPEETAQNLIDSKIAIPYTETKQLDMFEEVPVIPTEIPYEESVVAPNVTLEVNEIIGVVNESEIKSETKVAQTKPKPRKDK